MYKRFGKRLLDIAVSFVGIVLLTPAWLLFAVAIKLDSPGPVFFRQKRVGKGKRNFYILKYRTMRDDAPHDVPTHLMEKSDAYITRMGRILRTTSLDELPQLFNVLAGQMSLVGPRPALWNQDYLVAERDKYGANDVRPGITGWAQVNGRDTLREDVKARLDGDYARSISLRMDARCVLRTFSKVWRHEDVVEGRSPSEGK